MKKLVGYLTRILQSSVLQTVSHDPLVALKINFVTFDSIEKQEKEELVLEYFTHKNDMYYFMKLSLCCVYSVLHVNVFLCILAKDFESPDLK